MSASAKFELTPPRTHAPSFKGAIDRFFDFSLYLLIVTGFGTLASTGRLDPLSIIAGWTALIVRGYLLLRGRTVTIPERWTSYLTIFYALFYAADFLFLSGSFVTATVHLVLFVMVVKIFSVQRERDHIYLVVLSFLEVLAAAILTVDTLFLAAFCVFTILAVATFISMEMRRSAAGADPVPAPPIAHPQRRLARSLSFTAVTLMLAIVVGAGGIFFILPRLSAGYLSNFAPHNEFVTGFSDTVQLGAIGRIKQSDQVVMHIQIENDHGGYASLKWRGTALANFDGRSWTNTSESREPHIGLGRFPIADAQERLENLVHETMYVSTRRLMYHVTMEPIGTNVLFLAPVPTLITGRLREISIDEMGAVWNEDHSRLLEGYTAVSVLQNAMASRSTAAADVRHLDAAFLRVQNVDSRIVDLARQITANTTQPYDQANAIELYLRTRFGYTLEMPSTPPADPIADFLFVRKEGHCEYFASAMAIMLRTIGIPSRVVNGFRNGEYNDVTGSYIVRGRDAHSWVEAYIPGAGWTEFDPTPADPKPDFGSLHRLSLYMDAAREFWREWVINYDFLHQQNLTISAMLKGRSAGDRFRLWVRQRYVRLLAGAKHSYERGRNASRRDIGTAILAFSLLLLILRAGPILRHWRERRLARNPQRAPDLAASIWYARLLKRLSRRGWHKRPAQTPEEFVASIDDPALRLSVERFTARYESARFGRSAEDAQRLPELYEEITRK